MQLAIVEFARNVVGWSDAHSAELDPATTHPVIHLMPEQDGVEDIGGTLRLGSYPCTLDKESKAYELYGSETITERHRHRYEVNNYYRDDLTKHGMKLSFTGRTHRGNDGTSGSPLVHRHTGSSGIQEPSKPATSFIQRLRWRSTGL